MWMISEVMVYSIPTGPSIAYRYIDIARHHRSLPMTEAYLLAFFSMSGSFLLELTHNIIMSGN